MTAQTITIEINWPRIHAACEALDVARRGSNIGHDGLSDAFGGTYYGAQYESAGLPGLVRIAAAADRMAHDAWDTLHGAATKLRAADAITVPAIVSWYAVGALGRPDVLCASRRGAKARATRYGGSAERRTTPDDLGRARKVAAAREHVIDEARAAVRVALALHDLRLALADAGVIDYRAASVICGQADGRLNVTGLGWLSGDARETSCTTVAAAEAFAAGGLPALRIARAA